MPSPDPDNESTTSDEVPGRILDLDVETDRPTRDWIPPRSVLERAYINACEGVPLDKVGQLRQLIEIVFLNPDIHAWDVSNAQQTVRDIMGVPSGSLGSPDDETTSTSESSYDESSSSEDEVQSSISSIGDQSLPSPTPAPDEDTSSSSEESSSSPDESSSSTTISSTTSSSESSTSPEESETTDPSTSSDTEEQEQELEIPEHTAPDLGLI